MNHPKNRVRASSCKEINEKKHLGKNCTHHFFAQELLLQRSVEFRAARQRRRWAPFPFPSPYAKGRHRYGGQKCMRRGQLATNDRHTRLIFHES